MARECDAAMLDTIIWCALTQLSAPSHTITRQEALPFKILVISGYKTARISAPYTVLQFLLIQMPDPASYTMTSISPRHNKKSSVVPAIGHFDAFNYFRESIQVTREGLERCRGVVWGESPRSCPSWPLISVSTYSLATKLCQALIIHVFRAFLESEQLNWKERVARHVLA